MNIDINNRIGNTILQNVSGEAYHVYIPKKLPPDPPLRLEELYPHIDLATQSLAELNNRIKIIPNTALFIYMYVRKEALLSSQIEGTQSSFSDLILLEHHQAVHISLDDVEEVSNYVIAM